MVEKNSIRYAIRMLSVVSVFFWEKSELLQRRDTFLEYGFQSCIATLVERFDAYGNHFFMIGMAQVKSITAF